MKLEFDASVGLQNWTLGCYTKEERTCSRKGKVEVRGQWDRENLMG